MVVGSGKHTRTDTIGSVAYNLMKRIQTNEHLPSMLIVKTQYASEGLLTQFKKPPHHFRFLIATMGDKIGDHAFNVVKRFHEGSYFVMFASTHGMLPERAKKVRAKLEPQLEEEGLDGEVVTRGGDHQAENPAHAIVDAADEFDVDIVVMGVPRKSKETLGSTSKYVAKHVQRNVLLAFGEV